jgi:transposase
MDKVFISFDSHKYYTLCSVENAGGKIMEETRIEHERGAISAYLKRWPRGNDVAVETIGNWYWIVDEIEAAGMNPLLVHARKAKMMLCSANKTDSLDVRGLNRLQRNQVLPCVWIPPSDLRDRRDLPRTRMRFVKLRTNLKSRLHATLDKYAIGVPDVSDIYGKKGRAELEKNLELLPENTRFAARLQLAQIDALEAEVNAINTRMEEKFMENEEIVLLKTLPGIGFILAVVVWTEIGDITRFGSCQRLAAYAGTTPRIHSSGGKSRHGQLRVDVNRYLKWAFAEAGNSISANHKKLPHRHVSAMYVKIRERKGHQKAIGAVARHLAEAVYYVLSTKKAYIDPACGRVSSMRA